MNELRGMKLALAGLLLAAALPAAAKPAPGRAPAETRSPGSAAILAEAPPPARGEQMGDPDDSILPRSKGDPRVAPFKTERTAAATSLALPRSALDSQLQVAQGEQMGIPGDWILPDPNSFGRAVAPRVIELGLLELVKDGDAPQNPDIPAIGRVRVFVVASH